VPCDRHYKASSHFSLFCERDEKHVKPYLHALCAFMSCIWTNSPLITLITTSYLFEIKFLSVITSVLYIVCFFITSQFLHWTVVLLLCESYCCIYSIITFRNTWFYFIQTCKSSGNFTYHEIEICTYYYSELMVYLVFHHYGMKYLHNKDWRHSMDVWMPIKYQFIVVYTNKHLMITKLVIEAYYLLDFNTL
jgi:hypothetical protein